jgi:hypothetical protein
MIKPEFDFWSVMLPYHGKLRHLQDVLYSLSTQLRILGNEVNDLIHQIEENATQVNEQMKQFEEGFAYERPKTPSRPRKKPVLHGVESKRNKRKPNKISKYVNKSL